MHLSDRGGGSNVLLRQGMWRVMPETGQVALSEQDLAAILNTDPIEKWYILDPEPIARLVPLPKKQHFSINSNNTVTYINNTVTYINNTVP